jgi:hypothetical protein
MMQTVKYCIFVLVYAFNVNAKIWNETLADETLEGSRGLDHGLLDRCRVHALLEWIQTLSFLLERIRAT